MAMKEILPGVDRYLDPGSGSALLQTVLASLLGAGVLFHTLRRVIVRWFTRRGPGLKTKHHAESSSQDRDMD